MLILIKPADYTCHRNKRKCLIEPARLVGFVDKTQASARPEDQGAKELRIVSMSF